MVSDDFRRKGGGGGGGGGAGERVGITEFILIQLILEGNLASIP